ncbi:DNA-binding response regulator [Betaproteobacteria bacterium GR16-43]|nr:DNA-binding response regulator [Betaproteobacteria bacterium GR16-43]
MEAHILVVDDDPAIRELIREYLAENDFKVSVAETGGDMDRVLAVEVVDLVILDLKLPDEDGLAIARRLRESLDLPIIILTGRKDEADRVMGLELGADDYVTKPFSQRELLARIKAVLRRTEGKRAARRGESVRAYIFAGWELNTGTRRLKAPDANSVELTNSEYALLVAFLRSPQRVLTRDQLLEASRLHDDIYDRSIDVQILRLRRKVEESPNSPNLIKTERGAGYYLNCTVETK